MQIYSAGEAPSVHTQLFSSNLGLYTRIRYLVKNGMHQSSLIWSKKTTLWISINSEAFWATFLDRHSIILISSGEVICQPLPCNYKYYSSFCKNNGTHRILTMFFPVISVTLVKIFSSQNGYLIQKLSSCPKKWPSQYDVLDINFKITDPVLVAQVNSYYSYRNKKSVRFTISQESLIQWSFTIWWCPEGWMIKLSSKIALPCWKMYNIRTIWQNAHFP